jgi:hypothetical protein
MNNYIISTVKANAIAIPLAVIEFLIISIPFYFFLGKELFLEGLDSPLFKLHYFFPILIVAALLHELLHIIGFLLFGKIGKNEVKLGFIPKYLTPYAHCKVAITAKAYRLALLLPFGVVGIIPILLSYYYKSVWLNLFGLIFVIAASGDLIVFWLIRKIHKNTLLKDHPFECGCTIGSE